MSKTLFPATALCLAGGLALSCGKGISDGKGEVYAFSTVDVMGETIELREATLHIYDGTVDAPSTIGLRRYDSVDPSGAVGPVFEITLPDPQTLRRDSRLDIHTIPEVLAAPSGTYKVGFLSPPGQPAKWSWVPTTSTTYSDCPQSSMCGAVQVQSFTQPGGGAPPANLLRMAILKTCPGGIGECGSLQTCQSDICQKCFDPTFCNP